MRRSVDELEEGSTVGGEGGGCQSDPGTVGRGHFTFADLEKSGSNFSNNSIGLREVWLSS